jgi:DNA-directed RNA polymerase subunit H (RpoH/RPB5)
MTRKRKHTEETDEEEELEQELDADEDGEIDDLIATTDHEEEESDDNNEIEEDEENTLENVDEEDSQKPVEEDDDVNSDRAFSRYLNVVQVRGRFQTNSSIVDVVNQIVKVRGFQKTIDNENEWVTENLETKVILLVFFEHQNKLSIERAREIRIRRREFGNRAKQVLIVNDLMTSSAKKFLDELPCLLSIFTTDELGRFYVNHDLIPKHVVLSAKEANELLKSCHLKRSECPNYPSCDPIVKIYGWPRGTLILCMRKFGAELQVAPYLRCVDSDKCEELVPCEKKSK